MQSQFNIWKSINVIPIISTGYRRKITLSCQQMQKKHLVKFNTLYLKTLSRLRIEGNSFNLKKNFIKKPTADIIHDGEKLETFLLDQEQDKIMMLLFTTVFQHHLERPNQCNNTRRGNKSGRQGNPLQYSCLVNSMNKAWWATVHGITKSWIQLND